jgi:hypothetical protein
MKMKIKIDASKLPDEIEIEVKGEKEDFINQNPNFINTPFNYTELGWDVINNAILNRIDIISVEPEE